MLYIRGAMRRVSDGTVSFYSTSENNLSNCNLLFCFGPGFLKYSTPVFYSNIFTQVSHHPSFRHSVSQLITNVCLRMWQLFLRLVSVSMAPTLHISFTWILSHQINLILCSVSPDTLLLPVFCNPVKLLDECILLSCSHISCWNRKLGWDILKSFFEIFIY